MGRQLDAQWQAWIKTHLWRGSSHRELREKLLRIGFDDDAIGDALATASNVAAIAAPPPDRPAINVPNATRFQSSSIELYTAPDFLSPAECAELVAVIGKSLRPSTMTGQVGGDTRYRTSRTCDLIGKDPATVALDASVNAAMGIDPAFAEPAQGQWYDVGQEFKPHNDFFRQYELDAQSTQAWGQRTWTFMIYLNEPEGGGGTRFVDLGLTIEPRLGMALFWNNLTSTGEGNYFTRHQGLPVTAGKKVIITKWFRRAPAGKRPSFISATIAWSQLVKA